MKTAKRCGLASLAVMVLIGCSGKGDADKGEPSADKDKAEASKPEGESRPAPAPSPEYDEGELRKMLQGKWVTGDPGNPQATFVFTGDEAEVTTHKILDSATKKPFVHKGKLEIRGANKLTIRSADGNGYVYSFVKLDDRLHMGAGSVYYVDTLEGFRLELSMGEVLEFSATGCKWSVDFAGKKDARDVACSVAEVDGKKVFKYQSPDHFDNSKLSDSALLIAGKYLVSEQMVGEVATRLE